MGTKFRRYEHGDKISARNLNNIIDMLPKYDNILMNGQYFDCGNGQVMLNTGSNKFGSTDSGGSKVLYPFATRWQCTSKTDKNQGEWQIYLPTGCATLDGNYVYFPKNENGKDKEGDLTFQWYKMVEPSDKDATVTTINGYSYKEWTVYVHFKDFPIMYASTIQDDTAFDGSSQDLIVGSLLQKEWNDKSGKHHYSRKSTNYMTSRYQRTLQNNSGTFQIIFDVQGDKKSEESYKMKLTNQVIQYGVRGQAYIKDDTNISEKEEVVLKIDHSKEDVTIEIVDGLSENTDDYTYIRLLKLKDKGIKIDNREDARRRFPFYGK